MNAITRRHDLHADFRAWVADSNLAMQTLFARDLAMACRNSEVSAETVAERLGVDLSTARDAMTGTLDLTLTEIRHLAIAAELVVEYRVTPARHLALTEIAGAAVDGILDALWVDVPDEADETDIRTVAGQRRQ